MNDTPETDSLLLRESLLDYKKITEIISLCQKMERERNKWKEKAERLQAACNNSHEAEKGILNKYY